MGETPRVVKILEAFTEQAKARCSLLAGGGYDLPFSFDLPSERLPFLFVWDMQPQSFNLTDFADRYFNDLPVTTIVLFDCADDGDDTPRRKGHRLEAELLKAMVPVENDDAAGGTAWDCVPVVSVIQDVIEGAPSGRAALRMDWAVKYHMRANDPWN
jgi:hypothetical protein